MQENARHNVYEDEIDLKELFLTIWKKKIFIVVFTAIITILAIIYVSFKTQIYEVKSVIKIGHIKNSLSEYSSTNTLLEPSAILEQKLKLIYGVDDPRRYEFIEDGVVSKISTIKNVENFIEITTEAYSNEKALEKNKEVLDFIQNEYKYKIDEFVQKTDIKIKDIESKIKYAKEVKRVDLEQNIEKINTQMLPRIEKEIELLKSVELVSLEKKLEFNREKLKEYEAEVARISKQKSGDNSQNMLMAVQLLNTQNLSLSVQNSIENLIREKENLINIKLVDLEKTKENIIKETLRKAKVELEINFLKELDDLNDSLELEKLKLTNDSFRNSELVSDYIVNDFPVKPKKSLTIAVAFVTGFILSIFLVFFMQFIGNIRKDIKQ